MTAGSVRSSAVIATETSPETPVSSSRAPTSWSSGRLAGRSSWKSETISVLVPAIQPASARTADAATTLPGIEIEAARERGPSFERLDRKRETQAGAETFAPAPCAFATMGASRDSRSLPSSPVVMDRTARPAVMARKNAIARPPTRSSPNDWTIGIGERIRTRKPAAVASAAVATTGPPFAAASAAARARRRAAAARLGEARVELDRVIDRQADQDREARDNGHRERAAEERQGAEGDGARGQADAQRQQAKRRAEDEREHERHHHERRREQDRDLALELVGQAVGKDGCAGDEIRGVPDLKDVLRDHRADLIDCLGALLLGEVGAQADRDRGRVGGREEGRELRLGGRLGEARVEDDGADELRVADRGEIESEPVLDAERHRLLEELVLDRFRRRVGRELRLLLAESLLDRSAVGLLRRRPWPAPAPRPAAAGTARPPGSRTG